MRAHFKLPSVQSEDHEAKPPIQVKFEIPYFTTSGIQVENLKQKKKRNDFELLDFHLFNGRFDI